MRKFREAIRRDSCDLDFYLQLIVEAERHGLKFENFEKYSKIAAAIESLVEKYDKAREANDRAATRSIKFKLKLFAEKILPKESLEIVVSDYLENYSSVVMAPRKRHIYEDYYTLEVSYHLKHKDPSEDHHEDLSIYSEGAVFLGVITKISDKKFGVFYNNFDEMFARQEVDALREIREIESNFKTDIARISSVRRNLVKDVDERMKKGYVTEEDGEMEREYYENLSDEDIFDQYISLDRNYKEITDILNKGPSIENYTYNITWDWEETGEFPVFPDEVFPDEDSAILAMKHNYDTWFADRYRDYEISNFDKDYSPNTPLFYQGYEFSV